MNTYSPFVKRALIIAIIGFAIASILISAMRAAPANPPVNAGTTTTGGGAGGNPPTPIPTTPEPKEYVGAGGGGGAAAFCYSGGPECKALPPTGSMTFSGGEIQIDHKPIGSLVIGDGATKPSFAWKATGGNPPMRWICAGGARFQKGFSYSVDVAFQGRTASCGAVTSVGQPAPVIGGIFVPSNPAGSGTLYVPKIETTAVPAKSNPNTWRKKIGVGEQVVCRLVGAPGGCTVVWSVSGAVCTIDPSGYSATLTAGDSETSAVVTAAFSKENPSISGTERVTLQVIPPSGVTARKLDEGMVSLPQQYQEQIKVLVQNANTPIAAAGACMILEWHFLPDDVSFYRVQWIEKQAPAEGLHGCYLSGALAHPENPYWYGIKVNNDSAAYDTVFAWKGATNQSIPSWYGFVNPTDPATREAGGSFVWYIPWCWRVINHIDEHNMGANTHQVQITEDGIMTIDKLGQATTEAMQIYLP